MSFGYRILKSFSRTTGRNRSGNDVKQAVNAGVCTLPPSRLHEYNGSNDGRLRMHPVPLSASSRGTLHIYFSNLHLRDGALSYVKLPFVNRKFVVLNSAELARTVLSMRSTDGRLGLFLQDHVLENKGFSFQDLGEREDRHKRFLKTFLCQRAKSLEMFLKEETGKISEQVCQTHIDCNFDVQLQQILCAVFSKLLIHDDNKESD
ncbi:hypothetical protein MAR_010453 [Mya arenaria]|uniref:Uncharacterized protein n=1 Tax=Mya arenaria TaxID=6604 RepID=A0ABY7E4M5_MYAAR|nr:hypothetical protein MAR_010453 [Mya arenaria]